MKGLSLIALATVLAQASLATVKVNVSNGLAPASTWTGEFLVTFRSDFDRQIACARWNLVPLHALRSNPNQWVVRPRRIQSVELSALRNDPLVVQAFLNEHWNLKKDFTPNDPYYALNFPLAGMPGQWTLNDTTGANLDVRALPAWTLTTGSTSVIVGIVDDGFETSHPDLSANYNSLNSFDFGQSDTNPSPVSTEDNHGTAIAGIIAARGGNSIGITGIMPQGRWSGLRIDFSNLTTAQLVDATQFNSIGSTPTIRIKNHSYGPDSPFVDGAAEVTAMANSAATGTLHVRSAGNLRGTIAEDANKATVRNAVDAITVAAIDSRGRFSDYSSYGANVFVSAPSGASASGTRLILTTDRFTGDLGFNRNGAADVDPLTDGAYTSLFGTDFDGGTSVAAGLVSGALGLAEALNPNINGRLAKHLLARTSRQIDASDTSASGFTWRTNNAGFRFNLNYGFGLLDTSALLAEAQRWNGVTDLQTSAISTTTVSTAIPDNNTTGVSRTFLIANTRPLEEMQITVNVTHPYRGDLELLITSARGTQSRVFATALADDGDNINFSFTTHAFWGENPSGTWTLQMRDRASTDTGTWNSYSVVARHGLPTKQVTGSFSFGDLSNPLTPIPAEVSLLDSNGVALQTESITVTSGQTFSFSTTLSAATSLRVTTPNWLRKAAPISLANRINNVGSIALINGDVDQSIEVDAADIDGVIANFGNSGSGFVPGDVDWSGEVDAADIDVVIANFGSTGD